MTYGVKSARRKERDADFALDGPPSPKKLPRLLDCSAGRSFQASSEYARVLPAGAAEPSSGSAEARSGIPEAEAALALAPAPTDEGAAAAGCHVRHGLLSSFAAGFGACARPRTGVRARSCTGGGIK